MSKQLLLGDEAIAQAALDAGLSGVYAYPGTPSTEITEYIQASPVTATRNIHNASPVTATRNIHNHWCTNEKTAMEAALGMSFAGKRSLVCMKHVGMNVAADCFINAAITGVKGGMIVVAADDPSMHSSQNEQDSRFYGDFSLIPMYEPSNQQEAYDMVYDGFRFSEEMGEPILLRIVTRLAHSRSRRTTSLSATIRASLSFCRATHANATKSSCNARKNLSKPPKNRLTIVMWMVLTKNWVSWLVASATIILWKAIPKAASIPY